MASSDPTEDGGGGYGFFNSYIEGEEEKTVFVSEEKKAFLRLMENNLEMKLLVALAKGKGFLFEYMEDKRELESTTTFSEEEYKGVWMGPDVDGKHIVAAVQIIENRNNNSNQNNNNSKKGGRKKRRGRGAGKKKAGPTSNSNGENTQNETNAVGSEPNKKKLLGVISYGVGDGLDHIKSVAVSPAFKGRKIGTLLVCLAQVHLKECLLEDHHYQMGNEGRKKLIILFVEGGPEKEYVKKFYNTLGYSVADEENLGVACYGAESSCGHYMVCSDAFQAGYLERIFKQQRR